MIRSTHVVQCHPATSAKLFQCSYVGMDETVGKQLFWYHATDVTINVASLLYLHVDNFNMQAE